MNLRMKGEGKQIKKEIKKEIKRERGGSKEKE